MTVCCASCQQPLTCSENGFICHHCGRQYARRACCPTCRQPLEVLKACGAVDYFCQTHGLISSRKVLFEPVSG